MKILIICSNLIGDTVLSTGVISYLQKKYPYASFTFVIGPNAQPLLKNFRNLFEKIYFVEFHNINNYTASWKNEKLLILVKK